MPSFYLECYQCLKEAIDESGTLNQRYGGKIKGVKSSELEKSLSFVKIYRRLKVTIDNFDVVHLQQGTWIYMSANDMIEEI